MKGQKILAKDQRDKHEILIIEFGWDKEQKILLASTRGVKKTRKTVDRIESNWTGIFGLVLNQFDLVVISI